MSSKIYYLDDEPRLCEMIEIYFQDLNIELKTFVDAKTAIAAANAEPPDLMFIDFRLPMMSGDEVAQQITAPVPLILITGELQVQTDYDFAAVIAKPFAFDELLAHVRLHCPGTQV